MKLNIKLSLLAFGFLAATVGTLLPTPAYAAPAVKQCNSGFLTFPAWYDGLLDGNCKIDFPKGESGTTSQESKGLSEFIFTIVLNIVEILLQLVGYAAVGYIIYGGFKYLTSAGSADRITSGRKIITNSLIGLVISFLSVAVVNLVSVGIQSSGDTNCDTSTNGAIDPDCVGIAKVDDAKAISGILNTVYYTAGIAAVIVIIVSAIFYVISQGEPAKIKRAKDGILYAIVGLVIILLAFVITNFVIGRF